MNETTQIQYDANILHCTRQLHYSVNNENSIDKGFAAGCSRDVIERGALQLGWDLDKLLTMTLEAMKATEDEINQEVEDIQ